MMNPTVFKFCSAVGAIGILENKSIFITSPLDLNDPFEMRPAWTDAHEQRHRENQERRNRRTVGWPIFLATDDGTFPQISNMPLMEEPPSIPVDDHRGIADIHNSKVFDLLHEKYRVLSFSTGIVDLESSHSDSDENTTLLWSHYGDSFQGVCLAIDSTKFDNGMKDGGYDVDYSPHRISLPATFYDTWLKFETMATGVEPIGSDLESGYFIDFLTKKSPAWKYEQEVRMIYDLHDHSRAERRGRIFFPCEHCRKQGINVDKCDRPLYRDSIQLPPNAVKAVIFGTDASLKDVEHILRILSEPAFSDVSIYWSSLHSERYVVQYNRDCRDNNQDYVAVMQRLREEQVARAKGHLHSTKGGLEYFPSKKTINYQLSTR